MKYSDIEKKYVQANIQGHYKFANANEILLVLGYNIKNTDGFNKLSVEDQRLVELLICKYISGYGLEARENLSPPKCIERGSKCFKITFTNGDYSFLFDDGSVG